MNNYCTILKSPIGDITIIANDTAEQLFRLEQKTLKIWQKIPSAGWLHSNLVNILLVN